MLRRAKQNMLSADVEEMIEVSKSKFESLQKPAEYGTLIMNPPYDERLRIEEVDLFYKQIGDSLKRSFEGWDAWIFTANLEAAKRVGLRPSARIKMYNGRWKRNS